MNRGASLVEVMVGLALGMAILSGLMFFSAKLAHRYHRVRSGLSVRDSLKMAHGEVLELVGGTEPDFFTHFPVRDDLIHPVDHGHGSAQFSEPCPENDETDCLILWDIRPVNEEPVIYRVESALGYPERVALTPVDETYPPGPSSAITNGGVLFFHNGANGFHAVVDETENRDVILIPGQYQPWEMPRDLGGDEYEAIYLGVIEVTHLSIRPDEHTGQKLNYQPWKVDRDGWSASRSRTSYGYLHTLKWQPCGPGNPDRFVLIGSAPDSEALDPPVSIAGRSFDKEVWCVSIEL